MFKKQQIILKTAFHRKGSENQVEVTLCYETCAFIREISFCKSVSLSVPGSERWLNL